MSVCNAVAATHDCNTVGWVNDRCRTLKLPSELKTLSDPGKVSTILSLPTSAAWPDINHLLASGSSYHALLRRQRPTEAESLCCYRLLQENPYRFQGMKCK